MKVLMIGTDRKIFEQGSDVRLRMVAYGGIVDRLDIIVYATRAHGVPAVDDIAPNVRAHATRSWSRWLYPLDAVRIGWRVNRPDLVTAQDPADTGIAGLVLSRHFGAKLELQVHGDLLGPGFRGESFVNWARSWVAARMLPLADGIRVVSNRSWTNIVAALGERVSSRLHAVVPVFVRTAQNNAERSDANREALFPGLSHVVLMISRLEREKNVELGIDAFALVSKTFPGAGLVVVGDGSAREQLKAYANRAGVGGSVRFLGWRNDIGMLCANADSYLMTSNHEGNPRTPVEATYAGCPVVMTDVGTAGEIFIDGESALVAPVGDARRLAGHLERLAGDPSLRRALVHRARILADEHLITDEQAYLETLKRLWESELASQ